MNLLPFVALFLLLHITSGCATIVNGSNVDVTLATKPPGATATINGQTYITSNQVTVPIRRGKEGTIHIEKEGYESQDVRLNRQLGGWVWGNILFGGLIGFGIDLISEKGYGIDPNEVNVTLNPATKISATAANSTPFPQNVPPLTPSDIDIPPARQATRRPHAHAVVIGIETYRNQLPKADYAEQDAKVVSSYLSSSMGFEENNIAVLVNDHATKSDFEKYFENWLPNRVEKDDTVFVFYSGHGAPNAKTGQAYLVPYDGDPVFLESTGYPLHRLYQKLSDLPANEIVVVLDSCFSGAGGRSVIAKGMRPIITEVRNPVLANGKTLLIAASTGEQVSSTYEQKRHGLLTYFFLKGLQGDGDTNKDGKIEVTELFEYLRPQVERTARREFNNEQTPQLLGPREVLDKGITLLE
jgi:hypothetical protein